MLKRILDAVQSLPTRKVVDPDTHAVLDYLTISAFLVTSGMLWNRNRRAAVAALLNGAFVMSFSMFTDYSGSLQRRIPFEVHGQLDIVQAAFAAVCPTIMGFEGEGPALFFRGQAMNEAMVLAVTDWYAQRENIARRHFERVA